MSKLSDNTVPNYVSLLSVIREEIRDNRGGLNIFDVELCEKLAWRIAKMIPNQVQLPKADELTVKEVLNFAGHSETVQKDMQKLRKVKSTEIDNRPTG